MKANLLLFFILILLISIRCTEKKNQTMFVLDNKLDIVGQQTLTPEILWKFGIITEYAISPVGGFAVCVVQHYNLKDNQGLGAIYLIDLQQQEQNPVRITDFDKSVWNVEWSKDGKRLRFLSKDALKVSQIYEYHLASKKETQLTKSDKNIDHFKFSPDNSKVLYVQRVKIKPEVSETYPDLPKANVRIITDLMYRHWDTWDNGEYAHLFVATAGNYGKIINHKDITAGEAWHTPLSPYFDYSDIQWDTQNEKIYYVSKKLTGIAAAINTNSDVYCYDVKNETTVNLTESNKGYDTHPLPSPDGKKLAWLSMVTPGYESDKNRLMIMDLNTKSVAEASSTIDNSVTKMVWKNDGQGLFLISGIDGTHQIFDYNSSDNNIRQLTKGWHTYSDIALSENGLIGKKTSMTSAPELYKINTSTGAETPLTRINRHLYESLVFGKIESKIIKTQDWKDMQVWMIYPPDFDSTKTYPALLYCQGGPQQAITPTWGNRWNFQLLAAQGFIIIAPNRRGTPTFGSEWLKQISGDYSGKNIQDYLTAADMAAKLPYVDKNRMGALGASYGGYSVYYLAGVHQKRFKAFMSHCGMFNLESFYGTTEELFFANHDIGGAYWDKQNYTAQRSYANSPHKLVQNWDTPILITVGEHDYRVTYDQSLQAFSAARLKGLPAKMLFFPEETHFVAQPQNAVLWQKELLGWFREYLQPKAE